MRALIKIAILASVVAGAACMARLPAFPAPPNHGNVARQDCAREAGLDRDSQQACITGKLLGQYVEEGGLRR